MSNDPGLVRVRIHRNVVAKIREYIRTDIEQGDFGSDWAHNEESLSSQIDVAFCHMQTRIDRLEDNVDASVAALRLLERREDNYAANSEECRRLTSANMRLQLRLNFAQAEAATYLKQITDGIEAQNDLAYKTVAQVRKEHARDPTLTERIRSAAKAVRDYICRSSVDL